MSESDQDQQQQQDQAEPTQARVIPMHVQAQYIKDLSFESPGAPATLKREGGAPQMDVSVSMDGRKLPEDGENAYEVVLSVRAEAKQGEQTMFLAELDYGMVCSLADIPEQHHHPILMIEGPKIAFPFVRQILADMTLQGGFPPLYLAPVDFEGLYRDQYRAQQEAAQAQAAGGMN